MWVCVCVCVGVGVGEFVLHHRSAEVVLTLRNRGIESYKPADYGDTVTVHRTIRDDGTTSYKIKAANGRCTHSSWDLSGECGTLLASVVCVELDSMYVGSYGFCID